MHRSKLSTFVIDCKTDIQGLTAATDFWSAALGRRAKPPEPKALRYRELECAPSEPLLLLQAVEHDSRIHLDIESDDIEAEVSRLEALGARRVENVSRWVVMEAPTGQRFCVVRPQRGEGGLGARTWPSALAAAPFAGTQEHARLAALAGTWVGRTQTWLDPNAAPEESVSELLVESVHGGRWVRLQTWGTVSGKPHSGELLLGFHRDAGEHELAWVDSFHTGSALMFSHGAPRADGTVVVTGPYLAGGEKWGWRTELHFGDALTLKAFNISPSGVEDRAIETVWTRPR